MNPFEILAAVEEKMNNALLAYCKTEWSDAEVHKALIDDLRKATTEFLELRGQLSRGRELTLLRS
jgi:hypothetical protein